MTSLSDDALSDFTSNLASSLEGVFASINIDPNDSSVNASSANLNATLQVVNQVYSILDSLTVSETISPSVLTSTLSLFGSMLSQSPSFFNNLDTVSENSASSVSSASVK